MLKTIEWGADGLQKTWCDGKTTKLESRLNDFVVGLLKVEEAVKACRLKQEREECLTHQAEQRCLRKERQWWKELVGRQRLEQAAPSWGNAQQLRSYLPAFNEKLVG